MKALPSNEKPSRFDEAVILGRQIVGAVDACSAKMAEFGIDARFGLADGNWHPSALNDFRKGYDLLSTFEWDQVKYLRQRSRSFTGFNLTHMRKAGELKSDEPIPDYEALLPEECPPELLSRWKQMTAGVPSRFIFRPPSILGEVGWWVDDTILNMDTLAYQERMSLLWSARLLDNPDKIMEIGGGYGGLACAIIASCPECKYWICDLPESLMFSGMYLTMATNKEVRLWPEQGSITLVPNYLFNQVTDKFDLFVNTLSMMEMTAYQAEIYMNGILRLMNSSSRFFEQNHKNHQLGITDDIKQMASQIFPNRIAVPSWFPTLYGQADVWSK